MVSNLIDKDGRQSKGVLLLRTLAMPSDTNANGDIFGGWIMSQMDMGGAILAKEIAHGRVVTVAVESMNFIKPNAVGDVVCCYGQCLSVGRSSIKIKVEVWVKKLRANQLVNAIVSPMRYLPSLQSMRMENLAVFRVKVTMN